MTAAGMFACSDRALTFPVLHLVNKRFALRPSIVLSVYSCHLECPHSCYFTRYDVGEDDESQDSADAAVRAARLAANTSHNSGRHQVNKSKSSSSSTGRDGSTAAAAALLAQRDAEVATLRAETDALRRAYAALEADALAKAEEQEAVRLDGDWEGGGRRILVCMLSCVKN